MSIKKQANYRPSPKMLKGLTEAIKLTKVSGNFLIEACMYKAIGQLVPKHVQELADQAALLMAAPIIRALNERWEDQIKSRPEKLIINSDLFFSIRKAAVEFEESKADIRAFKNGDQSKRPPSFVDAAEYCTYEMLPQVVADMISIRLQVGDHETVKAFHDAIRSFNNRGLRAAPVPAGQANLSRWSELIEYWENEVQPAQKIRTRQARLKKAVASRRSVQRRTHSNPLR